MFISLKERLNNWIKQDGYVKYEDIKFACENGKFSGKYYRMETATRRLRNESPDVKADIGEKGYIKGYFWQGEKIQYEHYKVEGMNKIVRLEI